MFDSIFGKIKKLSDKHAVVVNGGMGYSVICSRNSVKGLEEGEDAFLFLHLAVRADALTLYGFTSEDERSMFETFISISGLGPKLAIELLSSFSTSQLKTYILSENIDMLTEVPGLGAKKAKRLVMESKDKIKELTMKVENSIESDILEALSSLGYNKREILKNMKSYNDIEEGIRDLLPKLSK